MTLDECIACLLLLGCYTDGGEEYLTIFAPEHTSWRGSGDIADFPLRPGGKYWVWHVVDREMDDAMQLRPIHYGEPFDYERFVNAVAAALEG